MVYSHIPVDTFLRSASDLQQITIEILLLPEAESYKYVARIMSLYDVQNRENFFISQWRSQFGIDTIKADRETYRHLGINNVLLKGQKKLMTITSDAQGTTIYTNGTVTKTFPRYRILPEGQLLSGRLLLGNSPTGKPAWNGILSGIALYNRALTNDAVFQNYDSWTKDDSSPLLSQQGLVALYLFNEGTGNAVHDRTGHGLDLYIPAVFDPPKKIFLVTPWETFRFTWSHVSDAIINIIGFMPLGFFVFSFLLQVTRLNKKLLFTTTALTGSIISLIIEIAQAYLPTRHSSLLDVLTNTLGTVLGILLCNLFFSTRVQK